MLDQLSYELSILLKLTIDSTTTTAYTSTTNSKSYLIFCKKHGLSIEPTPDMLSYYIIYQLHIIIPDSVDSYLSGIINQLEPYYPDA